MEEIKKEKFLSDSLLPVSIKGIEIILNQMKKCICKILKNDGIKGTGFFCEIPYQSKLLPVLVTNNHVLNLNDINNKQNITISINDDHDFKHIQIDNSRKKFTNENLDVTFIEINKEKDKINDFLEIDEYINRTDVDLNAIFAKSSIYILNYQEGNNIFASYGLLSRIEEDKNIYHLCNTKNGSSGSPIISLKSHKVIGIHVGHGKFEFNNGILINYPINVFNNNINNQNSSQIKKISENINTINKKDCILDYTNIIKYLKKINENETIYKNQILSKLNNLLNVTEKIYLINKKWIIYYKDFFNYNKIMKNINNSDKALIKLIDNCQKYPEELNNFNNLSFDLHELKISSYDFKYPMNFELCNIKLFDLLIKDINNKNENEINFSK